MNSVAVIFSLLSLAYFAAAYLSRTNRIAFRNYLRIGMIFGAVSFFLFLFRFNDS